MPTIRHSRYWVEGMVGRYIGTKTIRCLRQNIAGSQTIWLRLGNGASIQDIITRAVINALSHEQGESESIYSSSVTVVDYKAISSAPSNSQLLSAVDCDHLRDANGSFSVQIQPLGFAGQSILSPHKTYLLVGLSGDLGMSIVEWMANQGARYFAIASRRPRFNPGVNNHLTKLGVIQLRTWELDIADETALCRVHAEMVASMPPIVGVANGATGMILRDRPSNDMTVDEFEAVLRPKA
ncbi:KR domain-containing protein [Nemania sp. FL0916]|nr:KR domain-containing protein [Nemania sp. FL0916]